MSSALMLFRGSYTDYEKSRNKICIYENSRIYLYDKHRR